MVEVGNKIMYRGEVCTVRDLVEKYKNDEDYYVLVSANDASLIIYAPTRTATETMRPLISAHAVRKLVKSIPNIATVEITTGNRGLEYKELLQEGSHESIVAIIKTAYLRQQTQAESRQKPSENDKLHLRQAERALYSEIAATLGMSHGEAREYLLGALTKACE